MECADRNPKRSVEGVASGSAEPSACKRKTEKKEKEKHRKRKAEEESIIEEEMEGRVKSRSMEEDDTRRKQEEESKGKSKKEGCETRGDTDKTLNVDMMEEDELGKKKDLRERKVPLVILQGLDWKRVAQLGDIQCIGGEY